MNSFFNALPGACAQGLIWGIMAIGVYITFRVLDFADLTVDGTISTGAAVLVMSMLGGANVYLALLYAFIAGCIAGLVTGGSSDSSLFERRKDGITARSRTVAP